jgi:hypothetical protein
MYTEQDISAAYLEVTESSRYLAPKPSADPAFRGHWRDGYQTIEETHEAVSLG